VIASTTSSTGARPPGTAPFSHLFFFPPVSDIVFSVQHILSGLNEKQVQAVTTTEGPVLVISGPGSGKTRCLTHRIAYLIASGVPAADILAITFTNKAAGEIKERTKILLSKDSSSKNSGRLSAKPTIGTFHALGLRILRREAAALGYNTHFTILDSSDQQALMKRVLNTLELDPKRHSPGSMLGKISKLKTELITPASYEPSSFHEKVLARVYLAYQNELARMNSVDFGDLIMLPVRIFQNHSDILERYRRLWRYILVDEYQDTSHDQYTLITMLAAGHRNLFCIGDDAQSIYLFRQADIRNILNFQKDYPEGAVILLEQNYRSTKTILAAAQAVIANNKAQIPKELWTDNDRGTPIVVTETLSERHEAQNIVATLQNLPRNHYTLSDCAVLYRTHAQSRALEEGLVRAGIPYQIIGGIRFYERKEVKDLLAYLRILNNPSDVISFERIANVPPRGMGPTTVERIVATGCDDCIESISTLGNTLNPTSKAATAFTAFHTLMTRLRDRAAQRTAAQLIADVTSAIRYEDYLRSLKGQAYENAEERIENVRELLTVAKKYDADGPAGLQRFLEEVSLLQDTDSPRGHSGETVTLMTMHAAKGLEFPIVFIAGMEEGLFPHSRTMFEPNELEEERRLCYVAITRAKEQLHVTLAKWRTIYGSRQANIPSRFLSEIPEHLLTRKNIDPEEWPDTFSIDYDV
jgi:ATP-dependent DNA helicase UvrD/PcrA